MRLERVTIRDHRSVWGPPLELRLAPRVTAIVGPNRSGKSNVVRALANALDPTVEIDLARDRPVRRPQAVPEVTLDFGDGQERVRAVVAWAAPGSRTLATTPDGARDRLPIGDGAVLYCPADATLGSLLAHRPPVPGDSDRLEAVLREELDRVIPGVGDVDVGAAGVEVRDTDGFALSVASGVRVVGAIGLARHLAESGARLGGVVIEQPEAWLHPAAQEAVRDRLEQLADLTGAPVVVTTESPFVTPRTGGSRVIAVAKDARGATRFVGAARGDEPQAALLGGLLRDPGLGAVLDRTARLGEDVTSVLVVEGGTDEAYLRLAARVLDRTADLDGLAVVPAGGAMAAALQAIVLRAEIGLPLLVLLDNDDPGRRSKDTLTGRFEFDNRRQVMTYAEVVPDHPVGVEAEDLFDWRLVQRYVREHGSTAIRGKHLIRRDEWHFDLTSSAKSAFIGWLEEHVEPRHLERWDDLLSVVTERLGEGHGRR